MWLEGSASLRRAEVAVYVHVVMGITRVTSLHDLMHYLKECFVSSMGRTGSMLLFRRRADA